MKYGYKWTTGFGIFILGLFIAIIVAIIPIQAEAQHRHYHKPHHHWHHNWIVPALISGAVVYAVTRPDSITIQQSPVVIQNQYIIVDGITYKRELLIINGISQEVWIRQ
jgi:hypothetical protein